jgi:hypothetical protein
MVAKRDVDNYKVAFGKVFGQDYDDWMKTTVAMYLDLQI